MRVILHIGQHKTGSKALQSALYANRSELAARGIAYPITGRAAEPLRPYEMNHHRLFAAVRAAVDAGEKPVALAAVRACLGGLFASCPATTHTMILSAEDLFDMHTAHEAGFAAGRIVAASQLLAGELAGHSRDVRVVCYLRRQDHLLAAHYAQYIKGSTAHHPAFTEFQAVFSPRLDTEAILAPWDAAFGSDRICVAAYEPRRMPGGIVADFFRRGLGLEPPSVTVPFPADLEAFNVTPSRAHLEYIRLLNRRASRGRPVLPREHVLESAFRDRDAPAGVAAWLSPRERATLLAQHEPGNRRIAARHGLGEALFAEPAPAPSDRWTPHPAPDLGRLVELDARARTMAVVRRGAGRVGRRWWRRRRTRVILWVVSPQAAPAATAAATDLFAAVAGCPGLESQVVGNLGPKTAIALWRRAVFIVLVGPADGAWQETLACWALKRGGAKVVTLPGPLPEELLAA